MACGWLEKRLVKKYSGRLRLQFQVKYDKTRESGGGGGLASGRISIGNETESSSFRGPPKEVVAE